MVEFSNKSNYSYILNNDTISNKTQTFLIKKKNINIFMDFAILIIDLLIVIGPSIGYFLQSLKFKQTKSSKGFSKSLCLIIYFSQILRVFFWIGKPFKITLLYQSILIILFQIYLIHLWVKYHGATYQVKNITQNQVNEPNYCEQKDLIEYIIDWSDTISPNKIWNWSNQIEYFKFMSLIALVLLLISGLIGIHNVLLTNIYGTISVTSEASTLIPQILVSCRTKNAGNLSTSMVALWFIGDSCKFIYNLKYKTPIQMIISGAFQIFLDFFCLMQILCYKDKNQLNKDDSKKEEITIPNIKDKKVQQINQLMNKIEDRFDSLNKNNKNNNENIKDINKVENKSDYSDKVEVLDKSKEEHINYASDDEYNNNNEINEENIKNESNKTVTNLKEEGE